MPRHSLSAPAALGHATRGLSLLELLIAMLLGLLLSAGMVSVFLASKQNYYYEEQLARLQENGRYAMRLLQRELSMAGFFGGAVDMGALIPASVAADCGIGDWALDGKHPVELVNDHRGKSAPVSLRATVFSCLGGTEVVPLTDLVSIKRTAADPSWRDGLPAPGLTRSATQQWYLRLVDGRQPRWHKLRPMDLPGADAGSLSVSYWEVATRVFYIRRYSDSSNKKDGVPTLCMDNLAGSAISARCLVEGVENMQLEFGIDTDADGVANRYMAAPGGADMERAVSARIHLLLRSINAIAGYRDLRSYQLGQHLVEARGDGFLRRVFSTTVQLRNRITVAG